MSVFQRLVRAIGERNSLKLINLYPPYLGAGVRLKHASEDLSVIEMEMPLRPWNQNFVGTQFGGSLYSMCDPFFMLMVLTRLGGQFVVWDKSAAIDFLRPGRGTVTARFEVTAERLAQIRAEVEAAGKAHPRFEVDVVAEDGERVARIAKVLSVRPKGYSSSKNRSV